MKNIIAPILFIVGIILICLFVIPIQVYKPYGGFNRSYSNIFTEYNIEYSRLILYLLIWVLLCLALHVILKNLFSEKRKVIS